MLVRLRLDKINFKFKINLSNFDNNFIYFADRWKLSNKNCSKDWCNFYIRDFFFFGNKELIKNIISNLYIQLKEEEEKEKIRPEYQLNRYLILYKEKIKFIGRIKPEIGYSKNFVQNKKLSDNYYRIYNTILYNK